MIASKNPTIALGATPIGSAGNIKIEQKRGNSELFCAGYDNGRREKGICF
jgi:hypothetical protein